ncbi:hypothetical protein, variant [Fonticula alba]|uniref:Threonylcarbamoyl-AMP synthase n=1 Tax=Fonticula alba TaxID=691883 RepID=A0A058Z8C3_FONAL|nr:hypothetical protein, variant [Fonticula alba]KCV70371.1 hypothetical protein, variant [Fonticula alba]|eukprot:XP_009494887.1 hypothetical protein, variant [Fonticula alba]
MPSFWPGPLTLILPIRPGTLSHLTTAGLSTVGVRQVAHPITQKLLEMVDIPVAAPSANVSGRPSPTCAQHVLDDYDGAVPVLEGGVSGVGVESTIVDCTLPASAATDDGGLPWVALLRPGGVPVSALLPFCRVRLPEADLAPSGPCGHDAQATSISSSGQQVVSLPAAEAPRAPGMKYAHYAPQAPVQLVDGSTGFMVRMIHEAWAGPGSRADGARRVGVLTTDEAARQITRQLGFPEDACVRPAPASSSGDGPRSPGPPPPARTFADILPNDVLPRARSVPHPEDPARELVLISLGPAHDVETAARTLYHTLREFDRLGADAILISAPRRFDADTGAAEADRDVGLGLALVNRLVKASAHRVVAEGGPQ